MWPPPPAGCRSQEDAEAQLPCGRGQLQVPLLVTTNAGGLCFRHPRPRPSHATCEPFVVFKELSQILCSWFISHKGLGAPAL